MYEEESGEGRPAPLLEVAGAGQGTAAHSDTVRGPRAPGADPRCTCAAHGGPVGGRLEDHRPVVTCFGRAGDRCAQDHSSGRGLAPRRSS